VRDGLNEIINKIIFIFRLYLMEEPNASEMQKKIGQENVEDEEIGED
jgi:hypothetical protein